MQGSHWNYYLRSQFQTAWTQNIIGFMFDIMSKKYIWLLFRQILIKAGYHISKESKFISNTSLNIRPRLSRCTIHISRPFIPIHSVGSEKFRRSMLGKESEAAVWCVYCAQRDVYGFTIMQTAAYAIAILLHLRN